MNFLKKIQKNALDQYHDFQKITQHDIDELANLDYKKNIEAQQKKMAELSQDKKDAKKWPDHKIKEYDAAVQAIACHKEKTAKATLQDFIKLHKVLHEAFGLMIDKVAMWERDLYFASLAAIWVTHQKPSEVLNKNTNGINKFTQCQPPIHTKCENMKCKDANGYVFQNDLVQKLDHLNMIAKDENTKIRNIFAHFSFLDQQHEEHVDNLNFTDLVEYLRTLLRYDRKQKNAITKSIKELFQREGFIY